MASCPNAGPRLGRPLVKGGCTIRRGKAHKPSMRTNVSFGVSNATDHLAKGSRDMLE
jgi:hypothetical protein